MHGRTACGRTPSDRLAPRNATVAPATTVPQTSHVRVRSTQGGPAAAFGHRSATHAQPIDGRIGLTEMTANLNAFCDRGIIQAVPHSSSTRTDSRMVLATTILVSSLAFIDGSVINVGLPAIATSLSAGGGGLSWNGYLLPLSALLLIGGAAGDVFGRRRLLILGVGMFILASVMCVAAAPSLPLLVTGRALQGIGAAMLMPNSLAILGAAFKNEDRGRAIGIWAAAGAAASAVGPLLGGWLIGVVGWRSIFLINVPIGAASSALAVRYLDYDPVETKPTLDVLGAGLIAAALLALTWGLTIASDQKGVSVETACVLGAGGLLFVGFLYVEKSYGEAAMMPLSLFGSASFIGLTLLTLLLYGALGGLLLLVPYVLIEARGYSATMAGAALLPLPLVVALTSSQMGKLAVRTGARAPLSIGSIIVAVGLHPRHSRRNRGQLLGDDIPRGSGSLARNGGRGGAANDGCARFRRDEPDWRRLGPQQRSRTNRRLSCNGGRERGPRGAREDACERLPDRVSSRSWRRSHFGTMRIFVGACARHVGRVRCGDIRRSGLMLVVGPVEATVRDIGLWLTPRFRIWLSCVRLSRLSGRRRLK